MNGRFSDSSTRCFRSEKMEMNYDVTQDPTLPHTYNASCPDCVCTVGKNDEALVLVFVCVRCSKIWLSSEE